MQPDDALQRLVAGDDITDEYMDLAHDRMQSRGVPNPGISDRTGFYQRPFVPGSSDSLYALVPSPDNGKYVTYPSNGSAPYLFGWQVSLEPITISNPPKYTWHVSGRPTQIWWPMAPTDATGNYRQLEWFVSTQYAVVSELTGRLAVVYVYVPDYTSTIAVLEGDLTYRSYARAHHPTVTAFKLRVYDKSLNSSAKIASGTEVFIFRDQVDTNSYDSGSYLTYGKWYATAETCSDIVGA